MSGVNYILVYIAVVVLIFLVCREIVAWYFKINERNALLKENNRLLRKMVNIQVQLHPDYGVEAETDNENSDTKASTEIPTNKPALLPD